ncbi:MAG: HDOD domain-containing protein [Thermodesulfobacteriota bacterium]
MTDLFTYLQALQIPNLQAEAVKRAFEAPRGQPAWIAPPPGSRRGPPPPPARKVVRWRAPLSKPGAPRQPARTVLVVDLADAMIRVLGTAFTGSNLEVRHADHPQVFVSALTGILPDFIMLAAFLGKVDGCLLSTRIRTDPRSAAVPVIMYSAARSRREIVQAFDAGISDYLVMPVNAQTFRGRLGQVLEQVGKTLPASAADPSVAPEAAEDSTPPVRLDLPALVRKVESIMAVPVVIARILRISGTETAGAKELAQSVESDSATVSAVLKKANSAFFGKGEPIRDAKQAIDRMGFSEVRNIALGLSVIKQFSQEQRSNGFNRFDFWRHSLACGILARLFAEQARYPAPEDAFVAGLLHDLGKIVLDEHHNPPYADVVLAAIRSQRPLAQMESIQLGYSHAEVGEALCRAWKLPDHIRVAVGQHHGLHFPAGDKTDPQHVLLARLIFVANIFAKVLCVGSAGDLAIQEPPQATWARSFPKLALGPEEVERVREELARLGEFLEVGGAIGEAVTAGSELLPEVILLNPQPPPRMPWVLPVHLAIMGYRVRTFTDPDELPANIESETGLAICLEAERYDAVQSHLLRFSMRLGSAAVPTVIILSAQERELVEKEGRPERPLFLADHHTMLYEPYDIEQLHRGLKPA